MANNPSVFAPILCFTHITIPVPRLFFYYYSLESHQLICIYFHQRPFS